MTDKPTNNILETKKKRFETFSFVLMVCEQTSVRTAGGCNKQEWKKWKEKPNLSKSTLRMRA